jgi:hypothetical protein
MGHANAYLYVKNEHNQKSGRPVLSELTTLVELEKECERLNRTIPELSDMRQISLNAIYRRCGKPTCHCAQVDEVFVGTITQRLGPGVSDKADNGQADPGVFTAVFHAPITSGSAASMNYS